MGLSESEARKLLERYGQEHVLRFWDDLDDSQRAEFLEDIAGVDFALMERLIDKWVRNEPPAERFDEIVPVSMITCDAPDRAQAEAAGEQALRDGRVGLFLVAGGQGTRLGYDGPKGTTPSARFRARACLNFTPRKSTTCRIAMAVCCHGTSW